MSFDNFFNRFSSFVFTLAVTGAFEPNTTVNRSTFAVKLNKFNALFTTGG